MADGYPDFEHLWEVPPELVPTDAEHKMLASQNPGIAAVWFERMMQAYVELILGFDEHKQLPLKNGGMYGLLQSVTRVAQETKSGRLHGHMLIKRYNFSNPNSPLPFHADFEQFHRIRGHTPLQLLQLHDVSEVETSSITSIQVPAFSSSTRSIGRSFCPMVSKEAGGFM